MNTPCRWMLATLALPALTAGFARAADLATPDELRQLLTDKKYQAVVQKASQALIAGGLDAKGPDRYALVMLKAEAQLQLRENLVASDTFAMAARTADNPTDEAVATASSELADRAPGLKYIPRGHGTPIDISDPNGRKDAFSALYTDMSAAQSSGLRDAKEATTLPPIMAEVKNLSKLKAIEIAATGSDTQTAATVKDLGDHSQNLITTELGNLSAEIKRIRDAASQVQTVWGQNNQPYTVAVGLGSQQRDRLQAIMRECDMLGPAAKQISDATGFEGLTAVASNADTVKSDALETALTANYQANTGYGNNNPPPPPPPYYPPNNNNNNNQPPVAGINNNNQNHKKTPPPQTPQKTPPAPKPPPPPAPKPPPPKK